MLSAATARVPWSVHGDRRLWLARAAWISSLLLAVGLFVGGIPVIVPEMRTPCDGAGCYTWQVSAHDLAGRSQLDSYVIYAIALEALFLGGCCLVAAIIAVRRPDDPMALFAAFTLTSFGASLSNVIRAFAITSPLWYWPRELIAFLGWASLFICFYVFPDGKFVPRWTRLAAAAWVVFITLHYVTPPAWGISPSTPAESGALGGGQSVFGVGLMLFFGSVVLAHVARYRHASTALQRQQTKWVIVGFAAAVGGFGLLVGLGSRLGMSETALTAQLVDLFLFYTILLLLPLSFALAILRYRLWDIDLIINRALVYGALTACVVGLYVVVVGYLGAVFQTGSNLIFSLAATGIVAVLVQPLRQRLQHAINRLMYGERDDPYTVLAHLGARLDAAIDPEAVLPAICETLTEALRLPYAAIALQTEGELSIAAADGEPAVAVTCLPLVYQHEPVGELRLGLRPGEASFGPIDLRLLNDLSRQAGVAAHAVRLTADLRRSREQLVLAREEERRRIRRDLHDGLGPVLGSLTLKLDVAEDLVERDPAATRTLLRTLSAESQTAIADIRRLVYALRPPTLDDFGLLAALREEANHYAPGGLQVTLDVPAQLPPLPAAVEVATYRIAQEALTNVARHAQVSRCAVRLAAQEAGWLELEIRDDGRGVPTIAERHLGVGLASMRERATELNGSCLVESLPAGGTRVAVRLPLRKEVAWNQSAC